MNKWKTSILAALSLFNAALGFAQDECCNPCAPLSSVCCFLDDISLAVDYLCWKPCVDGLDYATVTSETDGKFTLDYKGLCPDFQSGVRVILGRPSFYCDWGFIASYTYFKARDHHGFDDFASISSPLINPGLISCITELFDGVDASYKFFYNEWDALITYDMSCCNPCHLFQPFAGVAGLNLKQRFHIDLFQGVHEDIIRWDSDFWGVGLRAGIEYQYLFCNRLRFFTMVHGTMLAGEADNSYCQGICTFMDINDNDCCWFVPGYHISVGVMYDGCFCNKNYSLRLGYEFLEWRNLPTQRIFSGDEETWEQGRSSPNNTRTIGFQGLMAGAGITF